jgi:hypothetical protein
MHYIRPVNSRDQGLRLRELNKQLRATSDTAWPSDSEASSDEGSALSGRYEFNWDAASSRMIRAAPLEMTLSVSGRRPCTYIINLKNMNMKSSSKSPISACTRYDIDDHFYEL